MTWMKPLWICCKTAFRRILYQVWFHSHKWHDGDGSQPVLWVSGLPESSNVLWKVPVGRSQDDGRISFPLQMSAVVCTKPRSCCLVRSKYPSIEFKYPPKPYNRNEYAIQDGNPNGNTNGSRQQYEGIQERAGKNATMERPNSLYTCNN